MCATHLLIMLYLSVNFIKFASAVYEKHNFRHNLTFDLTDLDLGHRNPTLMPDTPSHYVLSFCEVSFKLLQ